MKINIYIMYDGVDGIDDAYDDGAVSKLASNG